MTRFLVSLAAVAWAGAASAADLPVYAPPASWVKPIPLTAPAAADPAPVRFLLLDAQAKLGPEQTEVYSDVALQILTPEALQAGNINLSWNPATETLIIHHVRVLRDGQVLDLLAAGQTFSVLRRETNLEKSALDGRLTAALQPEGLQVGDVLEFAITRQFRDPTLQGHSEIEGQVPSVIPIEHLHLRHIYPSALPVKWRETEGLDPYKLTTVPGGDSELVLDMTKVEAPKAPDGAPSRYGFTGVYQVSDYADWNEVSRMLAPLYAKAAALSSTSPLRAEAAKIAAMSPDPKVRAAAALRLVQDKVRYVFLGMNLGGLVPADADLTWSRRFGDCKGKTVLLLALLHELGVEAAPSLVATKRGDGLDTALPGVDSFDHVFVRAEIAGKTYWLDGTRTGDRDLDSLSAPPWFFTLPLTAQGSALEPLPMAPLEKPGHETHLTLDATAGLAAPAPVHIDEIFRGDAAIALHRGYANTTQADVEKKLRAQWKKSYDWIEIKKVGYSFDETTGEEHLTMDGAAAMAWSWNDAAGARRYETDGLQLGWKDAFKRETAPHMDAPFVLEHPSYDRTVEIITLPHGGKGFSIIDGGDISASVAGFEHKRTTQIDKGVFTADASTRSLMREFPGDHVAEARGALAALADVTVHIQAPKDYKDGGAEMALVLARTPETESEFRDRADILFDKGDLDGAVKNLDQATKLEPDLSVAYNVRCFFRAEANKDLPAALTDCNQAIKLAPDDASVFDSRGLVYYRLGQFDLALKDYDQAIKLSPDLVSSLYLRGIVKRRLGNRSEGDADIRAAKKIDADVVGDYKKYGIAP
jgi:tetratricopeptide (TPR) repeat protein